MAAQERRPPPAPWVLPGAIRAALFTHKLLHATCQPPCVAQVSALTSRHFLAAALTRCCTTFIAAGKHLRSHQRCSPRCSWRLSGIGGRLLAAGSGCAASSRRLPQPAAQILFFSAVSYPLEPYGSTSVPWP